MLVAKNMRI